MPLPVHAAPAARPAEPAGRGGKFLTFFLGDEEYGVEILKVQEIIGMQPITRVPGTPPFMRGVINLRGRVIPVLDLRARFGMPAADAADGATSALRCMVVVEVAAPHGGLVPVAIAVDRVSEVVAVADADVEDAPSFGAGVRTEFLLGIGKAAGRVRLLLAIDRVLAADELTAITHARSDAA